MTIRDRITGCENPRCSSWGMCAIHDPVHCWHPHWKVPALSVCCGCGMERNDTPLLAEEPK